LLLFFREKKEDPRRGNDKYKDRARKQPRSIYFVGCHSTRWVLSLFRKVTKRCWASPKWQWGHRHPVKKSPFLGLWEIFFSGSSFVRPSSEAATKKYNPRLLGFLGLLILNGQGCPFYGALATVVFFASVYLCELCERLFSFLSYL
jgi:hypothetical protein